MTDVLDPMALVADTRPKPSAHAQPFTPQAGAMRRARASVIQDHNGQERDANDFVTNPAAPDYREKIPNPPCAQCSQDHNPIWEVQGKYDHAYVHPAQEQMSNDGMVVLSTGQAPAAPQASTLAVATGAPPAAVQRVVINLARGDNDFIVGVEENPPDWDLTDSWKLTADEVLRFLPILRLLHVKIRDNTGGELKALELERTGH